MTVPTFDQLIFPLLQVLATAPKDLRAADAHQRVVDHIGLSEEALSLLLPSGQPVYQNRIGWAHDRLKRAGLSECPRRGVWQITALGRDFLGKYRSGIDEATLRALTYPRRSQTTLALLANPEPSDLVATISPEEQIHAALAQINDSLGAELLELIHKNTPSFFEKLVLDLLLAMGYGGSREDIQQVGGSGDGGIDGIISLDRLGLEKVYVQAKRWQNQVGRPDVQGFFGALAGRKANKGVFITTSDFSKEAREYARQVSVTLISGTDLAKLMIEYGVGVSFHKPIQIGKVDGDYFEEG